MRYLTIDNFEINSQTVATGDKADAMVRKDKEYWDAYNRARPTTKEE
tara:strand:+ start:308 stop:448 length:141 start_codon:yes stop_codon:yes gene_type:complete